MLLKRPKPVSVTQLKATSHRAKRVWSQVRRATLYIGGLGCFAIAAFSFAFWAGMVVTGVSLLVLEMLTEDNA